MDMNRTAASLRKRGLAVLLFLMAAAASMYTGTASSYAADDMIPAEEKTVDKTEEDLREDSAPAVSVQNKTESPAAQEGAPLPEVQPLQEKEAPAPEVQTVQEEVPAPEVQTVQEEVPAPVVQTLQEEEASAPEEQTLQEEEAPAPAEENMQGEEIPVSAALTVQEPESAPEEGTGEAKELTESTQENLQDRQEEIYPEEPVTSREPSELEWDKAIEVKPSDTLIDLSLPGSKKTDAVTGKITEDILLLASKEPNHLFYYAQQPAGKKKKDPQGLLYFYYTGSEIRVTIRNDGKKALTNIGFAAFFPGRDNGDVWIGIEKVAAGKTYTFSIPVSSGGKTLSFVCSGTYRGKDKDLLKYFKVMVTPPGFPPTDVKVGDSIDHMGEIDYDLTSNAKAPQAAATVEITQNVPVAMEPVSAPETETVTFSPLLSGLARTAVPEIVRQLSLYLPEVIVRIGFSHFVLYG